MNFHFKTWKTKEKTFLLTINLKYKFHSKYLDYDLNLKLTNAIKRSGNTFETMIKFNF